MKKLAADRNSVLEEALPRAQSFNDRWKKELTWLKNAEARAYADWRPCGLTQTCQEDLDKHKVNSVSLTEIIVLFSMCIRRELVLIQCYSIISIYSIFFIYVHVQFCMS